LQIIIKLLSKDVNLPFVGMGDHFIHLVNIWHLAPEQCNMQAPRTSWRELLM